MSLNKDERILNEIEHGRYLAHAGAGEIWNWESPAGKIRWKRRVKMLVDAIRPGDAVLELGCGTGYFTQELAHLDIHLTAIDISPELIQQAKETIVSDHVTFLIQNVCQMEFDHDCFHAVIGSSVLHHLELHKAIQETYRVLKPGGTIAFTEPNMLNPQIALLKNIPYLKQKLGDSPDETAFFKWKMQKLLKDHGFIQVEVIPFDFLHPAIPQKFIRFISAAGAFLEKIPVIKEIAGSLYIKAIKPQ